MNSNCVIYSIRHPKTNEIRYIGQTVGFKNRINTHLSHARIINKTAIHKFINSLLDNGAMPIFDIIEECHRDQLNDREIYWISYYRSIEVPLLNLTDGGETNKGIKFTEEHKRKISESNKGKKRSIETLERLKATQFKKGDPSWNKGMKYSIERRNKISISHLGLPSKSKKKIEYIGLEYDSLKDFCNKTGLPKSTISRRINDHGHYKGHVIKYLI